MFNSQLEERAMICGIYQFSWCILPPIPPISNYQHEITGSWEEMLKIKSLETIGVSSRTPLLNIHL